MKIIKNKNSSICTLNWGSFRRVCIEGRALEWVTPLQGLIEFSLEQKLQSPFKEEAAVQKGKVIFFFIF